MFAPRRGDGGRASGLPPLPSLLAGCRPADGSTTVMNPLPPADDRHTVALWLFDEPMYPNMTLTDAGPERADLRLGDRGRLTAGRNGNALEVGPTGGVAMAAVSIPRLVWSGVTIVQRPVAAPQRKTLYPFPLDPTASSRGSEP